MEAYSKHCAVVLLCDCDSWNEKFILILRCTFTTARNVALSLFALHNDPGAGFTLVLRWSTVTILKEILWIFYFAICVDNVIETTWKRKEIQLPKRPVYKYTSDSEECVAYC
jgi:hypothetical protein